MVFELVTIVIVANMKKKTRRCFVERDLDQPHFCIDPMYGFIYLYNTLMYTGDVVTRPLRGARMQGARSAAGERETCAASASCAARTSCASSS